MGRASRNRMLGSRLHKVQNANEAFCDDILVTGEKRREWIAKLYAVPGVREAHLSSYKWFDEARRKILTLEFRTKWTVPDYKLWDGYGE